MMRKPAIILLLAVALPWALLAQKAMETTMRNPDELFEYASGLYARKFYDMALKEQNSFLTLYPEDARVKEIMVMRINTLRYLGKVDEMISLIREYANANPKSKYLDGMFYAAGTVLFDSKKYQDAVEFLEKLATAKDASIQESSTYILSKCLFELGDREKSLALRKSLADRDLSTKHADRIYSAYEYAEALYHSGHAQESLAYYDRLAKVPDLEEPMLEQALYKIGVVYYQLGKNAEALAAFENYILRFPEAPNAKTVRKCRIALVWDGKASADKTLELARDWQRRYPDAADWDVDEILASSLMMTGNFDEAAPYFQRLRLNPDVPAERRRSAAFNLVCCLANAGHYADAEEKAAAFLADYPNASHVGDVLGIYSQALVEQEKYQKAVEVLKREMVFYNEDLEHWRNTGYRLVNVHVKLSQNAEAAALLRGMSKRLKGEEKWYSLVRAAGFELQAGHAEAAKNDFKLVAENKEFPGIASNAKKSLIQFALNEKEHAVALEWVDKLLPELPEAEKSVFLYLRANLLYNMNRLEEAERQLASLLGMKELPEDDRVQAQVLLVSIFFYRQDYGAAIPLLDSIFRYGQLDRFVNISFLNIAGEAYVSGRNWGAAEAVYRRMLKSQEATPEDCLRIKGKIANCIRHQKGRLAEAEALFNEVLQDAEANPKMQAGISMAEMLSMLAEVELELGKGDFAAIHAERALPQAEDSRVQARTLFVLASVKLNAGEYEEANRYATQCFILMDDETYSPVAMSISIRAFRGLGQNEQAAQVLKELSSKYPTWLALHPEVK